MRKTAIASGLAALGLLSGACGGGTDTAGRSEPVRERTNTVKVDLAEYSYDAPKEVTGGPVTFELSNSGKEPHELALVKLARGKTTDDFVAALRAGKDVAWAEDFGGVPVLSPGLSTTFTRELDEGNWLFICMLPSAEGQPHAAHGMLHQFRVNGESNAPLPQQDFTVSVDEKGFSVPAIPAGRHTVELRNDGSKPHELALMSYEPGKSERDLGKWFESGYKTAAPALFPGGVQAIEPGVSVFMDIEFQSGRSYRFEDFPNQLSTVVDVP